MQADAANELIRRIESWVATQPAISGALLVGSYAHGTSCPDSDIDICLFTSRVDSFLQDREWLKAFGRLEKVEVEDWGAVKTLRTYFSDNCEVEFNFAEMTWASLNPIDPGTLQVVADGAQILYDPTGNLAELLKAVALAQCD